MGMGRRGFLRAAFFGGVSVIGLSSSRTRLFAAPASTQTTLSGSVVRRSGFEVPAGQTYTFDPDNSTIVQVSGNVIVRGTLVMRPARPDVVHILRFTGVDESRFVGGGNDPVASDVGLWVVDGGTLDLSGRSTGETVKASGVILDVGRNVRIEGTSSGRAHTFVRSTQPQSIVGVAFRHMGVGTVLGRYGLHFHHCADGSRGSVVADTVVRDSNSRGFVPHGSHGIAFQRCIVFRAVSDAYWWDPPAAGEDNASHAISFEDCVAASVVNFASSPTATGFTLATGDGNVVRRCLAVGIRGSAGSGGIGFQWPRSGSGDWLSEDNVAHHCEQGSLVWVENPQIIRRFRAYSNAYRDVSAGAYRSSTRYEDCSLESPGGLFEAGTSGTLGAHTFERCRVVGPFQIVDVAVDGTQGVEPVRVIECSVEGGVEVNQPGQSGDKPTSHEFVRCTRGGRDLEPSDFRVTAMHPASIILVIRRDGSSFEITG
jgi:hypothetical protein